MNEENLDGMVHGAPVLQVTESNVVNFQARRWDPERDPSYFQAHEALNAMLRDIEAGIKFDHIIVCYTRTDPESRELKMGYAQSGSVNGNFGAIGLLHHIINMIITKSST